VYLLSLTSAVRILAGPIRACAIVSLALVTVVAVFSEAFLLVPLAAALVALGARAVATRRARARARPHPA
jgi:hypothetical protein